MVCLPNKVLIVVGGARTTRLTCIIMKNNKVRKTLILAIFTAAALIIFLVEAQIPVIIAVPGIKLGLSNIIVLITLYFYGRKEAAAVLALKIILSSVFSGQHEASYTARRRLLCLVVMALLKADKREANLGRQRLRCNEPSMPVSLLPPY